eukprot:TRINITY_DN500_c0_g1_i6.p1 TRINITY_DN500_c0_g1~~TRINITY_DN500_c0_g1_i6.p1  ORF type:complete len:215 (-),score=33.04 TRINITY_DN500_c0_g1_i6:159-803(-)
MMGTIRARVLETIFESVSMPCQWQRNGCQFQGSRQERAEHEQICAHKTFLCPLGRGCACWIRRGGLEEHIRKEHDAQVLDINLEEAATMSAGFGRADRALRWTPLYRCDGQLFCLFVSIVGEELTVTPYILGPHDKTEQYTVQLSAREGWKDGFQLALSQRPCYMESLRGLAESETARNEARFVIRSVSERTNHVSTSGPVSYTHLTLPTIYSV